MKNKKNILVLSGGGLAGAFEIGAIEILNKYWKDITGLDTPMKFDKISGVSVGSLNGVMIAMGEYDKLMHLWYDLVGVNGVSEIYTSSMIEVVEKDQDATLKFLPEGLVQQLLPDFTFSFKFFRDLPMVFSKNKRLEFLKKLEEQILIEVSNNLRNFKGIADNTPLFEKLKKYVDRDKLISEYSCGFVSLDTGEYYSVAAEDFETNDDFILGVLASTTVPIVWTPVKKIRFRGKNGKMITARNCVDGGIRNVTPLGDVVRTIKPDEDCQIFIINCSDGQLLTEDYSEKNIGQIALRSLHEIAMGEIFNNDLSEFIKVNDMVRQNKENNAPDLYNYSWADRKRTDRVLRDFNYTIIEPDTGVLGNSLVSTQRIFLKRVIHGKEKALKALGKG